MSRTKDETNARVGRWPKVLFVATVTAAVIAVLWNVLFFALFSMTASEVVEYLWAGRNFSDVDMYLTLGWISVGLLPILFAVAMATLGWRRAAALAYGLEAPLVAMAILRLSGARAGTLATNLTFAIGVFGMVAFAMAIIRPFSHRAPVFGPRVTLSSATAAGLLTPTLLTGAWLALLLALFIPPFGVSLIDLTIKVVTNPGRVDAMLFVAVGLFVLSAMITLIVPFALMGLYFWVWGRSVLRGGAKAALASLAAVVVLLGSLWGVSQQPQVGVLAALAPEAAERVTDAQAQWILEDAPRLKRGLVSIVLSPYLYLAPRGELSALASMYERQGFSSELATNAQAIQSALLSPMLYDGEGTNEERAKARRLYSAVFDENVEAANREAFRDALAATWSWRQPSATLLDAAANTVRITTQSIDVEVDGPAAEVTWREAYVNRTFDNREVLYYFELPETAVVTGLWLGSTEDRNSAFKYRVSPRGAAQQVYKAQVRRSVDPALLEQVGPRQYRLRVFPVEGAPVSRGRPGEGAPLYMWLRYRTRPVAGRWPLPRILEARNAFFDRRTELTLNGESVGRSGDEWMPEWPAADAETRASVYVAGHRVDIGPAEADPGSVTGRWVVALDTSASMATIEAEIPKALDRLRQVLAADTPLVVTRSPYLKGAPTVVHGLDARPMWFGGLSLPEVWTQVRQAVSLEGVRGVLVLTDAGDGVEREAELDQPPELPVWFVHLGGRPAVAYDDQFLEALQQTGGGVTLSVNEALIRMSRPNLRYADGQTISITETATPASTAEGSAALRPLAAKWLIEAKAPHAGGDPAQLDRWHRLARAQSITTPFSSMIVLVNKRQHRQLDEAERGADRFDREVEDGQTRGQVAASGFPSSDLTAVPEPSTWLLLLTGVAVALAGRARISRRLGSR